MRLISGFRSPALEKAGCFRNGSRNEVSGATNTQGPPWHRHPHIQPRSKQTRSTHPQATVPKPHRRKTCQTILIIPAVTHRPARNSLEASVISSPSSRNPFKARKSDLRVGAPCNGVFTDTELNG